VLPELKRVLKEDDGLELNISKTVILSKTINSQGIFDVAHAFINDTPQLTQLGGEVSLDSFRPDDFVGIGPGVPITTDTFVRQFVVKTWRDIIENVEKLDAIEVMVTVVVSQTSFKYRNHPILRGVIVPHQDFFFSQKS